MKTKIKILILRNPGWAADEVLPLIFNKETK